MPAGRTVTCSGCVAGVYTPAFVERTTVMMMPMTIPSVAGVYTPAFVERPGSAAAVPPAPECRRSLYSGLR